MSAVKTPPDLHTESELFLLNNVLRYPHSCKYCRFSVNISVKRECFCKYKGAVAANDICGKYEFDPFKYKVRRLRNMDVSRYKSEDFSIE